MSKNIICRRLLISGRVQGVWYRGSMQNEAEKLGVTGWVKNRPDGRVEALVEGTTAAVETIVEWCWQGPPAAHIDHVDVSVDQPHGLRDFDIGY